MGTWETVDLSAKLFQNIEESVLRKSAAALENCFINEAGGHSRFPGLKAFVTLSGSANTYLYARKAPIGDLVAVSNSRVYLIDREANATDVTGVPVSGGQRVIFDETDNELVMAAGAEIIRLAKGTTEILSADAPLSTHVGYIDGYLVAVEVHSGRFQHSTANAFRTWDPLDTFSADGKPDEINGLLVSPYRELLLTGVESVEQFERLPSGTTPFFRRWSVGEGVLAPYTLVAVDQGNFAMNSAYEFVRFTGQVSEPAGDDLGVTFEKVTDWTDAWATAISIKGQKFILLQIPKSVNAYGTDGITCLYDYRQKKWYNLYGWEGSAPAKWPGCSYAEIWGRRFVGVAGGIYELDTEVYANVGQTQRMLGRTAPMDQWGPSFVDNVRMRVKRGVGATHDEDVAPPKIAFRSVRDGNRRTKWKYKSLGRPGDNYNTIQFGGMGHADSTWQFEWQITDPVSTEIVKLEAEVRKG
uniref:Uncharacterized protein n=1 Tax=viral metagenome TaxID=1070528 RepID=A0A6M3IS52_9ZZZZ